jgi:hypothetical protein
LKTGWTNLMGTFIKRKAGSFWILSASNMKRMSVIRIR